LSPCTDIGHFEEGWPIAVSSPGSASKG